MQKQMFKYCFHLMFIVLTLISYIKFAQGNKIFPISTEFQIGKIKHMLEQAPSGAYISVGSERSFRGASMMPHVNHVYLLDISPEIMRFNQINIALLKAPSRQLYCHFRWNASYEEWQKLNSSLTSKDFEWWQNHVRDLEKMNYPLPEALNKFKGLPYVQKFLKIRQKLFAFYQTWKSKELPTYPERQFIETINYNQLKSLSTKFAIPLHITPEEWEWWTTYGRNKKQECSKLWLENPEEAVDVGEIADFKTGNYLFSDKLYERLHNLAINNRFTTLQINLGNNLELENFLLMLKSKKELISVLDLDNLYFQDYLGQKIYNEVIKRFLPYGQDTSLLIVMSNYKDYACVQFQLYIGFTFENIQQWPQFFYMQSFIDTLPKGLLDLIDGRVYEKDEHPPYQYLLGNL